MEATKPSRERKLYPQKLVPPPEVLKKISEGRAGKLSDNKYIRFFQIFFGEGF